MDDVSFDAADKPANSDIVIDLQHVRNKVGELLSKTDLTKFIL